jgi:outer membrane protein assembly factor BamE
MRSGSLNQNNLSRGRTLRLILASILLAAASSSCVYRINIQQGNFLEPKAVDQLAAGMTRSQVRYLLGTPLASDPFDSERWDYVYYTKRGHSRHVEERKVTVYFEGDKVTRIDRPAGTDKRVAET